MLKKRRKNKLINHHIKLLKGKLFQEKAKIFRLIATTDNSLIYSKIYYFILASYKVPIKSIISKQFVGN